MTGVMSVGEMAIVESGYRYRESIMVWPKLMAWLISVFNDINAVNDIQWRKYSQ